MDQSRPPRRRRRGSGSVTLADVAKLAEVSQITASRALNAPATVAPDTLARVRAAIERTGYVPNRMAGGLASSRSRLVAAVVPTITGPIFLPTIQALTEELEAAGYQLLLGQSGYAQSREDALLDAIIGRRPDAIVLTGVMRSATGRKRLHASGIPVIETWDLTPTPIDMLDGFSHERAAETVADHLASIGRERIALLTADDPRAERRAKAFAHALARGSRGSLALRATHTVAAPGVLAAGRSGLAALLAEEPAIDAVFCSSDLIALGVLIEAHARGLDVPNDLAVAGFGDLDFAAETHPSLTTVRIDARAIGREAARLIVARAEGAAVADAVVDVGYELVVRQSA